MGKKLKVASGVALACAIVIAGVALELGVAKKLHTVVHADESAKAQVAREERTLPVVDPAPVPVPTALPLVGGDGTLPDGYPVAHVDGAALRSLLWHGNYADLDRYFGQLQDAFEADNKREYSIDGAADAFGSAEAELSPRLDAWVAATPNSFAPYLARASHSLALGWARRGEKWAKDTPDDDLAAMHEALQAAAVDADKALALRPKLIAAMVIRVRLLSAGPSQAEMRRVVDRATAICPGCFRIRASYLLDTTPRWGGTYAAMHAFAATCNPARNVRCRVLDGFVDYDQADLAWMAGRLPDAEAAIDRAVALGDCATFLVKRSAIRYARHDYEGALADADKALPLWFAPETLVARADALSGLRRWEPAGRMLLDAVRLEPTQRRAKEIGPYAVNGLLYEGMTDAGAGRRDDALRLLDLAAELAPSSPQVLGARARVLLGTNPDIAALEAAVAQNPDDLRLHQQLDYALSRQHDFARIAQMWTEFIARHPDEGRAYMERAGTYYNLGKQAESRADAAKACELGIAEGCMRAK